MNSTKHPVISKLKCRHPAIYAAFSRMSTYQIIEILQLKCNNIIEVKPKDQQTKKALPAEKLTGP